MAVDKNDLTALLKELQSNASSEESFDKLEEFLDIDPELMEQAMMGDPFDEINDIHMFDDDDATSFIDPDVRIEDLDI